MDQYGVSALSDLRLTACVKLARRRTVCHDVLMCAFQQFIASWNVYLASFNFTIPLFLLNIQKQLNTSRPVLCYWLQTVGLLKHDCVCTNLGVRRFPRSIVDFYIHCRCDVSCGTCSQMFYLYYWASSRGMPF